MGIIKTSKLVHEFIRRDEEGNVESITTALDNVNLDIKEGQFIAILGHNGSGKSTLAKHINALLAPSDGTIWVDGMDVSKEENVIPVRKSAGMVFQNPDNQIIANVVEEDNTKPVTSAAVYVEIGNIEAHNERTKEKYASNPDVDTSRSKYNFHLVKPPGKYRAESERQIAAAGCRSYLRSEHNIQQPTSFP